MNGILELYGISSRKPGVDWASVIESQNCPYLGRRCQKVRKSEPEITIGTCSVIYGSEKKPVIICPHRLLERRQVFLDCLHLLTLHEPGNELHIVPQVGIPGGTVDYFLASARGGKVRDFVGIELQALDTTGTVWPARQQFLMAKGLEMEVRAEDRGKRFGINWKMTAKTILVQLHHKLETFEGINKHLVLVVQDHFLDYVRRNFQFAHINSPARLGDPMHIHSYVLEGTDYGDRIALRERLSTDAAGIARSLGLQTNPRVGIEEIAALLERKITGETLFVIGGPA